MHIFCRFLYGADCPGYFWLYVANMTIPWQHFVNCYLYSFWFWVLGLYIIFYNKLLWWLGIPPYLGICAIAIERYLIEGSKAPFSFSEEQIAEMKMPYFWWIHTFAHIHTVAVYYAEGCYSYLNILKHCSRWIRENDIRKIIDKFQILRSINRPCFNNSLDIGINID